MHKSLSVDLASKSDHGELDKRPRQGFSGKDSNGYKRPNDSPDGTDLSALLLLLPSKLSEVR
jgi:hypothetical protein